MVFSHNLCNDVIVKGEIKPQNSVSQTDVFINKGDV